MNRLSRLLKIGIAAITLAVAVSGAGVALAYTILSLDMGPVTVQEPLVISLGQTDWEKGKAVYYPGQTLRSEYTVSNTGPVSYGLSLWMDFETDGPKGLKNPHVTIVVSNGEKIYDWGQPIRVEPGMAYRLVVEIRIPKSSPPGDFKNLRLNFERGEDPSPSTPPPPSSCTSSGGCG